jgi:hypothetical protein
MNEPLIMAWTVMPFKIVAKAWTDSTYKTALTGGSANDTLRASVWQLPWTNNYIIREDTNTDRYLPLPHFPSSLSAWTQEEVTDLLINETFGDDKLIYFLPARIIAKAFFDSQFKANLIADPNTYLANMGATIPQGVTFHIDENTTGGDTYLTLPKIPEEWGGLSYNDLLERLIIQINQISIIDLTTQMYDIIGEENDSPCAGRAVPWCTNRRRE